jgi:hypothetical protein
VPLGPEGPPNPPSLRQKVVALLVAISSPEAASTMSRCE